MQTPATSADAPDWNQALLDAVEKADIPAIRNALVNGANINHRHPSHHSTVLLTACNARGATNRTDLMRFLLDQGADPNLGNRRGFGPLRIASLANDAELVELLLDYGADPNQYNKSGMMPPEGDTALHEVASKNRNNVIKLLLQAGANPHAPDFHGKTPEQRVDALYVSIIGELHEYGQLPVLDEARSFAKADLFASHFGRNVLDNPVTWRYWPDICEQLDKNGESLNKADLMQTTANGVSYLRIAAQARMLDVVVKQLNKQGESLSVSELLQHDPAIEPLLHRHHVPNALCTRQNLELQGERSLQENLTRLPREGVAHLRNLDALRNSLSTEAIAQIGR